MTSSKDFFVNLEWVWRFSKLAPNSYVFIFLFYLFLFYFCFLKKRNEFGVSLEILQTRSKLICFHFFVIYSFWTRGMSLEWVWRFSKLTPNSVQTHMFSCFFYFTFFGKEEWVCSEFGDSPNSLQTRSKPKWFPSLFFSFLFGKNKRFWSELGGSPNSLQTHPKLAPNSYVFRFFCFFVLFYLFYFFGKRVMNLEWIWGFSKLTPNSNHFYFVLCVFPLLWS